MTDSRNTTATPWLRLYVAGITTSLVLMLTVALIGRHSHKTAAIIALACIHLATQVYGALCLWRLHRTSPAFDTLHAEP